MSEQNIEEIKKAPQEPEAQPEQKEGEILSRKRRIALVAYLSVLFAVAFLLVALSLVVENRHLQSSSEQTSASLNGKIAELQNEYAKLSDKAARQESELAQLEAQKAEADEALASLQRELEDVKAQLEQADAERTNLQVEHQVYANRIADLQRVHELLFQAQAANEAGDFAQLQRLMEEIAPMRYLLGPNAQEIYFSLTVD